MAQTQSEPKAKNITLGNGLKMRYYEWMGTRPNLVFLHPSTGYGRMWDKTASLLGGRFHAFALDQRGHGDTDRPDGAYSAEEYAEDLRLFLEISEISKAILVGHSLGGRVAQVFAAKYPKETAAIVLVGGPHYANFFQERERVNEVLQGALGTLESQTEFPNMEAALSYLKEFRPGDSDEITQHRLAHNTNSLPGGGLAFKFDKVRVAQGLTHIANSLRSYAEKATCPVAIVRGAQSTHLTRQEAERLATLWKDARIIEVDGDYTLEMENPQGLAQVILDFAPVAIPA
jgi:pimeloyl-ACP methyl ester carboxylesterase